MPLNCTIKVKYAFSSLFLNSSLYMNYAFYLIVHSYYVISYKYKSRAEYPSPLSIKIYKKITRTVMIQADLFMNGKYRYLGNIYRSLICTDSRLLCHPDILRWFYSFKVIFSPILKHFYPQNN
jgi:hypothetical protein